MPRKSFKLPSGGTTRNAAKYVTDWQALYKPISDALEVEVVGFDPDVLLKHPGGASVALPLWFAQRLSKLIKARDAEKAVPTEFSVVESYDWGETDPLRVVPARLQKKLFDKAIARMQIHGWADYLPGTKAILREFRCAKPRPGCKAMPTTYHIVFRPRRVLLNGFSLKDVRLHRGEPMGGSLSACNDPVN